MVIRAPDLGSPLKCGLGGRGAKIQDCSVLKFPVTLPLPLSLNQLRNLLSNKCCRPFDGL